MAAQVLEDCWPRCRCLRSVVGISADSLSAVTFRWKASTRFEVLCCRLAVPKCLSLNNNMDFIDFFFSQGGLSVKVFSHCIWFRFCLWERRGL